MVRIKHRYLLVEILYPSLPSKRSNPLSSTSNHAIPDKVLFHAPSPDHVNPGLLANVIRDKIGELYGDYGAGLVGLSLAVKYFSPATSTCILRCPRSSYRLVWSALTYLNAIPAPFKAGRNARGRGFATTNETPCVFRVVRMSGTMRKAETEAIRRARRAVLAVEESDVRGQNDELLGRLFRPDGLRDGGIDDIEDADDDHDMDESESE